jgi:hypothetical protein
MDEPRVHQCSSVEEKNMSRPICSAVFLVALAAGIFGAQPNADAQARKKYELHELDAGGVMLDAKIKAAYYKALGKLTSEPWLAKLDGPSPQNKRIAVAGADYVLVSSCKNHDCAENNAVLLYSPGQAVMYGKVYQRGKSTLIGGPPPEVAAELERLWKIEWRSQPR